MITVDTEVAYHDSPAAFGRDVLGGDPVNPRGAFWIAEQLKGYGLAGVFFLDVYGVGRYRGAPYRHLCDRLLESGHDVQLHTHPDQMYDPKRFSMHEYSPTEQTTIVREGMALLQTWTGRLPIAHRAGRYGANEATLQALKHNGICLDSSFYFGRPNCKLPFAHSNAPMSLHGVWEVPVTVAREPVAKLGYRFPFWTRRLWWRYQKLDVNTMRAWQLCRSVKELYGEVPYIVTFLHSFSFLKPTATGFEPDNDAIESFQSLLRMLVEQQYPVVTCQQVVADLAAAK